MACASGAGAQVRVGLDEIAASRGAGLSGKRVGLVAHAASVTVDGRHAIDVLRSSGVDIRRVFAPEHGLRGTAAAGEPVAWRRDEATGIPIVSLYGAQTQPSPEDLRGLDVLVFDLQDAGVRFYTYLGTMMLCMEAAAEAGIEFLVLDRPNPLGGERIEGPLSDPPERTARSLLNMTPGPLVHGLTAGEMARFVNARTTRPVRLRVVPMRGWARRMTWSETGRRWTPPSPNLRTAEAAMAYPGTALLEATEASEGRGTAAPFLLLGAPRLDGAAVAHDVHVAGFALQPTVFTPRASAAAPSPKHRGVACHGVRVSVTSASEAEPYRLGVTLLWWLRRNAPHVGWRDGGRALDRLVGTARLGEALGRGEAPEAIVAADSDDIRRFREERRGFLLY